MKKGVVAVTACATLLSGCQKDETLSAYAESGIYVLQTLDGEDAPVRATLELPGSGRVTGDGPCNRYAAEQTAPYPWFELGPIRATRRACPALGFESAFFDALARVSIAEVSGRTLILSRTEGPELVFQAEN